MGLSCLCALLFYGAALLWSRRGKSPWGLFLSGTLLQGFLEFGHVSGMVRRQEAVTAENAAQWVLFALLAVGTWYLLWRWEHPAAPKSDAAPAKRPLVVHLLVRFGLLPVRVLTGTWGLLNLFYQRRELPPEMAGWAVLLLAQTALELACVVMWFVDQRRAWYLSVGYFVADAAMGVAMCLCGLSTVSEQAAGLLAAVLLEGYYWLRRDRLLRARSEAAPKSDAAPAERPLVEWEPQTPGAHFCHRCGAALYPGAAFCGQCGAAVLTRNTAGHSEKDREES